MFLTLIHVHAIRQKLPFNAEKEKENQNRPQGKVFKVSKVWFQ